LRVKGAAVKEVFMKNNSVAKHANEFNKALKRGYSKHSKKEGRNNQESYQIAA
jgi:hypothetical protein